MVAPRPALAGESLWRRLARPFRRGAAPRQQPGNLFIIGAARTGTTVLQSALNHSPDIFLFDEPVLDEPPAPGFAERYNAMHRSWLNQETKSTYCPPVLKEDGGWPEYWERLGRHYRWVGAKTVINPLDGPAEIEALFAFQCQRFYEARYIFTFRRPLGVVNSTRGLQMLGGGQVTSLAANMASYAGAVAFYLRALRNLPNVKAVFHEDVSRETFADLERWLDVSLAGAETYYEDSRVQPYDKSGLDDEELRRYGLLDDLYDAVRAASSENGRRLQIGQNDGNITPGHYTPVGYATRKAAMIQQHFRDLATEEAAAASASEEPPQS